MTPAAERWGRRVVVAAAVAAVAVVLATVLDLDPEPLRVALLCLLLVVLVGLLADVPAGTTPRFYPPRRPPPVTSGRDPTTSAHLRHLEDHQRTRRPDPAVRDRLAVLADQVLRVRHGVPLDSERGRELLGPDLVEALTGPVVRLPPRRIDQLLRQIEELP